jgi:lysophospholipid acyltransferase (LPLAT)-like uncharacterized protein
MLKKLLSLKPVQWLLMFLVYIYAILIYRTGKWSVEGSHEMASYVRQSRPFIWVFWHGRMFLMPWLARYYGIRPVVLASKNRDGRLVSKWLSLNGFEVIYGSSSKGGSQAIREIWRHLAMGKIVVITPDGPRGPRYTIQSALIAIASRQQVPIFAVQVSSRRARFLKTWDRFLLPSFGDEGVFQIADPYFPYIYNKKSHDSFGYLDRDRMQKLLEQHMQEACIVLDKHMGHVSNY